MSHDTLFTDAQRELIADLDYVANHVHSEYEPRDPESFGTCGFARIANVSGNSSFVRRVQSLAKSPDQRFREQNRGYRVDMNGLTLTVTPAHRGGFSVSVANVGDFQPGPAHQRLDVRRELNDLVLVGLRRQGYLADAVVRTRMD